MKHTNVSTWLCDREPEHIKATMTAADSWDSHTTTFSLGGCSDWRVRCGASGAEIQMHLNAKTFIRRIFEPKTKLTVHI